MIEFVYTTGLVLLTLSILIALLRLARGPGIVDRIIAFDTVVICIVGLVVLMSLKWDTGLFLELVLIISSLGFFGTVAYVFYFHRKSRERDSQNLLGSRDDRGGES